MFMEVKSQGCILYLQSGWNDVFHTTGPSENFLVELNFGSLPSILDIEEDLEEKSPILG